jgi:uncharacterized protein YfiM (DUF2279 family)
MIAAAIILASNSDPMFGPDKAKHAAASFVLFTSAYALSDEPCGFRAAAAAGGITVSAGLLKEIYDWRTKGRFSWRDIFWDGVGLALGAGVVFLGRKEGQF